jgi:hypothetical protein
MARRRRHEIAVTLDRLAKHPYQFGALVVV